MSELIEIGALLDFNLRWAMPHGFIVAWHLSDDGRVIEGWTWSRCEDEEELVAEIIHAGDERARAFERWRIAHGI